MLNFRDRRLWTISTVLERLDFALGAGHYEYDQKTFSYGLNGSLDFIQCESQDRILELCIQ